MAESSLLVSATPLPFPSIVYRCTDDSLLPWPLTSSSYSGHRPSDLLRLTVRSSSSSSVPGNFIGDDSFGFFPWVNRDSDSEERVTLFTSEGLVQVGSSLVPRPVASDKQWKSKISQRSNRFQESDYMNPDQGLCVGALFDIAATNGLDLGRRLCILGFCRSIEMLSDVVEDAILEHGGEVVAAEKALKGGLHEKLTMTVAVPLLWGIPPASETLQLAVRRQLIRCSGSGISASSYLTSTRA